MDVFFYDLFNPGATEPYYDGISNDIDRRIREHIDSDRVTLGSRMQTIDTNVAYGKVRGYEQYYIEEYKTRTGTIGEDIPLLTVAINIIHLTIVELM